jgi:hypothetical protein
MTPERSYIIQKVKEWSKVLNNHPYHPSQVNWITQIEVLVVVKYSSALVQWDDTSIRQFDTVIRQIQWKTWKLPPGCPDLALWAGQDHGSLTYPNSKSIIIKEETGLLHQYTALDDDITRMVQWDMQNTVLRWGCNSLEETSKESSFQRKRWSSTATAPVPPPPENYIVGDDVYPEPPETKVIVVTVQPDTVAVADAPLPPPPENDILGAVV